MAQNPETEKLSEAVQAFETNLETPVVPGELLTWITDVHASCDRVGQLLRSVQPSHESQLREIGVQDPELLARVQDLRQEDEEILRDFDMLLREVSALRNLPTEQAENRPKVDDAISQIVERGLAFVIRVRKQETALSTWYMEAFQRDRGFGD